MKSLEEQDDVIMVIDCLAAFLAGEKHQIEAEKWQPCDREEKNKHEDRECCATLFPHGTCVVSGSITSLFDDDIDGHVGDQNEEEGHEETKHRVHYECSLPFGAFGDDKR